MIVTMPGLGAGAGIMVERLAIRRASRRNLRLRFFSSICNRL
jgi:hypothetical protein